MNEKKETVTNVNEGIRLIQDPTALAYGTDALMLAAFIRREPGRHALELGSGSGIISLLLGKRGKFRKITAVEIQPYYADLTRRNVLENGLSGVIDTVNADIRTWNGCADTVFSNPPYMRVTSGKPNSDEGKYAARHEVYGTVSELVGAVSGILRYGGRFCCVYRPDRLPELVTAMKENGIAPKRMAFVHGNPKIEPCLVLIEGKKGGGEGCRVLRPTFLSDSDGAITPDAEYIYTNGDWPE
ncbi:MAG: methyltransferase [Clostridia bacterium]|nr:methyltransferase [Clostridia bacterium]MBQ7604417.1 methyltransferase [Clostridia bacterium]